MPDLWRQGSELDLKGDKLVTGERNEKSSLSHTLFKIFESLLSVALFTVAMEALHS